MALFRKEAIEAQKPQYLGSIVLIRPLSFTVITALVLVIILGVIAFFIFGHYTRHSTVSGQLVLDQGLLKVYTPQVGTVIETKVKEGALVQKGQVLFVVSTERKSAVNQDIQATVNSQLDARKQNLEDELFKNRQILSEDQQEIRQKIEAFQSELSNVKVQSAYQADRVRLAEVTLGRYEGLLKKDFISKEQYQQRKEELLDQRARLESFNREKIALNREITVQKGILNTLALKNNSQISQIERALIGTAQEKTENEAKRQTIVVAPDSGIATGITAYNGQMVDSSKALVSIIPKNSTLIAELYAPSRTIGFIRPKEFVRIRYQAYPYQKFGHYSGVVESISKVALSNAETNNTPQNNSNESLYRIRVTLDQQYIMAYGEKQPLQVGMVLDADILQERLRIYEWVLEPITRLSGKL